MKGKIKWSQICDKKFFNLKIVTDLWQKNQFGKNCHKNLRVIFLFVLFSTCLSPLE